MVIFVLWQVCEKPWVACCTSFTSNNRQFQALTRTTSFVKFRLFDKKA